MLRLTQAPDRARARRPAVLEKAKSISQQPFSIVNSLLLEKAPVSKMEVNGSSRRSPEKSASCTAHRHAGAAVHPFPLALDQGAGSPETLRLAATQTFAFRRPSTGYNVQEASRRPTRRCQPMSGSTARRAAACISSIRATAGFWPTSSRRRQTCRDISRNWRWTNSHAIVWMDTRKPGSSANATDVEQDTIKAHNPFRQVHHKCWRHGPGHMALDLSSLITSSMLCVAPQSGSWLARRRPTRAGSSRREDNAVGPRQARRRRSDGPPNRRGTTQPGAPCLQGHRPDAPPTHPLYERLLEIYETLSCRNACRLQSSIHRLAAGNRIRPSRVNWLSVRDTVSMVRPR